ncbi:MAG TPA: hypothetical protein PLP04_20330 [Bryobacteraceae bacterium]|nr:hypothetical protein [Bryobacteraceae bacterium]
MPIPLSISFCSFPRPFPVHDGGAVGAQFRLPTLLSDFDLDATAPAEIVHRLVQLML